MTARLMVALVILTHGITARGEEDQGHKLPAVAPEWSIELIAQSPQVDFPTAITAAPDGTVFVGSDPMDMPGPATEPVDRVLAVKNGKATVFADKLWSVMGLEHVDGTVYVVHAPFLSALRDTNGDGKADSRVDLITGLGPKLPGFNGINDHIASGIRLGMDGFLYIAIGDKGIPRGVGRDGATIRLHGGGVIRIRRDGTGLEIVSTGECNPLSVALSATDEVFTYGNDDDSKKWPNSLTHHIVGGHFGYPYQFLTSPHRALPIMAAVPGGAGAQGICYNEDGLPAEYRGNLFFCDWGQQLVFRFEIKKAGGTFALSKRSTLVSKGAVPDFRPLSLTVASDGQGLLLSDWAFNGWLAKTPRAGRLYRLRYTGSKPNASTPRPDSDETTVRLKALDHPALAVRLESQRVLERKGVAVIPQLIERLKTPEPEAGRLHALWTLDAIGGAEARQAIGAMVADKSPRVRLQAVRSVGIRRDQSFVKQLLPLLNDRDAAVRREAAIAVGRVGDTSAGPPLYSALGESDTFAAWSVRQAIRRLDAWNKQSLVEALLDDRRLEAGLRLTDEVWAVPVVEALAEAMTQTPSIPVKARIVANLAGLYRRYPEWSGEWFGTNPLAGSFPRKTVDWSAEGMKRVEQGLVLALADRDRAVRFQAVVGLTEVGPSAAHWLRGALVKEADTVNQALIAEALGLLIDPLAAPVLAVILADGNRPEAVRAAALGALAKISDPQSLRARFNLLYDPKAPASLIARALPDLARLGFLPPNDLASFLQHAEPSVRAAAVLSLNVKKSLPDELRQAVLDRLVDPDSSVRAATMMAVVPLQLHAAVPRLLAVAADWSSADRIPAILALCGLPDARAVSFYVSAIQDRDPRLRKGGESALLAIRDRDGVRDQLNSALASNVLSESVMATLERVLARFEPIRDWRVIGPFPRTIGAEFLSEQAIDFKQTRVGVFGRQLSWTRRLGDAATGRMDLSDLKRGIGGQGGFGFDQNNSPELGAFAFSQLEAESAGPALLLIGSSGTLVAAINGRVVYQYNNPIGRGYAADTDLVRTELLKGTNRILVVCRQGIGPWSFGLQIARIVPRVRARATASASMERLRTFALAHDGDPKKGAAIFWGAKGIGCARCHTAGGHGNASIGPDLTGLAAKYDRAEVIRSILEPSHRIATGYLPVIVATRDGKVETGVVRSETETELELANADAKITRIPKSDIEVRRVGDVSIMSAKLVESLSPPEFSDLVSFLLSLKPTQESSNSNDGQPRHD